VRRERLETQKHPPQYDDEPCLRRAVNDALSRSIFVVVIIIIIKDIIIVVIKCYHYYYYYNRYQYHLESAKGRFFHLIRHQKFNNGNFQTKCTVYDKRTAKFVATRVKRVSNAFLEKRERPRENILLFIFIIVSN